MNVICVNCKEVSEIRPSKCDHCGGQTFEETHAKVIPKDIGTITWFKCKDKLPPRTENTFSYSETVIATDGKRVHEAVYCHNPATGGPYWHINASWAPTHWAYINLPEPVQD